MHHPRNFKAHNSSEDESRELTEESSHLATEKSPAFTTNIGPGGVRVTSNAVMVVSGSRNCPSNVFHLLSFLFLGWSRICWSKARLNIKKRSTVIQWSWTCLHPESKWYRIHFKSHPPSWHWWRASAVGPLTTQICVLYDDHENNSVDSSHVCSDKLRFPTRLQVAWVPPQS